MKVLLALLFISLVGVAACGKAVPTAPQPPSAVDLTPLVEFLDDPLVQLLPTLLEGPHESIQRAFVKLSMNAREGDVLAVRRSFESAREAIESYRDRPDFDGSDLVVLAAVELVLIRAEKILVSIDPQAGEGQIDGAILKV